MNTNVIKKAALNWKSVLAGCFWFFAACSDLPAQNPPVGKTTDSLLLAYPYINVGKNNIQNDSAVLDAFYEKLWELKTGKRDRITIVHIGDSHIQADFFSGKMRQNLQLQFGNAGRGLVFPYRIARSNEPTSYRTSNMGVWNSKRNVFINQPLPIGLCGFTVQTNDTNASLLLKVYDQPGLNYGFNKMSVYHAKGANCFQLSVCTEFNCAIGDLAREGDSFVSTITLDSLSHTIQITMSAPDTLSKTMELYGMLLENGQPGVLYNMIGVNGAECRHYNASTYFIQQLATLKPDLVIVSLGTNEAFYPGFKKDQYYANIDTLISHIREVAPDAGFLMTTPGDSFRKSRKGRIKNPDMQIARNTVVEYCSKHPVAYWDLWTIMGGYGSMAKWYASGMAQRDRLHFTRKGYELQAELFYRALMSSYDQYVNQHHNPK